MILYSPHKGVTLNKVKRNRWREREVLSKFEGKKKILVWISWNVVKDS